MPTKKDYETILIPINQIMEGILNYTTEDLVREKDLGTALCFKNAEDTIVNIQRILKSIDFELLGVAPIDQLVDFKNAIQAIINRFGQMQEFDPSAGNAVQQRDTIVTALDLQYKTLYETLAPIFINQFLNSSDLSTEKDKYNSLINELTQYKNSTILEGKNFSDQIKTTLQSARDAAAQSGVSKHSTLFKNESEDHNLKANSWLIATFVTVLIIVVTSVILIKFFPKEPSTGEIIQYTVSKIIILSALFYALSLSNRNFKAHKHNAIVNKHRQNALGTFETFSNAASADNQTKNAVLMEATRTIFSNQTTGYQDYGNDGESSNKVVEIFKGVTSNSNN